MVLSWIVYFFRTTFCGGGGGERECHANFPLSMVLCVKKFGGRAKVYVLFWIWRGVERENALQEIHSLVET